MNFELLFQQNVRLFERQAGEFLQQRQDAAARRAAHEDRKKKRAAEEEEKRKAQPVQQEDQQMMMLPQDEQPAVVEAPAQEQEQKQQQQQQPQEDQAVVDLVQLAAQQSKRAVEQAKAEEELRKNIKIDDPQQQQQQPQPQPTAEDGAAPALVAAVDQQAAGDQQQQSQQQQQPLQPLVAARNRPYVLAWERDILVELIYGNQSTGGPGRFSQHPVYVLPVSAAVAHSGIQCDSAMAVHSGTARIAILCGPGSVIISPEITQQSHEEVAVVVGQLLSSTVHKRHGIFTFRIADFLRQCSAGYTSDFLPGVPAGGDTPLFDVSVALSLLQRAGQEEVTAAEHSSTLSALAPLALPSLVRLLFPAQVIRQQITTTAADDDDDDPFSSAGGGATAAGGGGGKKKKKKKAAAKKVAALQQQQQQHDRLHAALASLDDNPLQFEERLVENDIFISCMAEARALFASRARDEPALAAGALANPERGTFPSVEAAFMFRAAADRVFNMCRSMGLIFAVQLNTGAEMCCALMEHHGFVVRRETLQQMEAGLLARGEYLDRRSKEAAASLQLFGAAFLPQQQQQQQQQDGSNAGADADGAGGVVLRRDFWAAQQQEQQQQQVQPQTPFFLRAVTLSQLWQKVLDPALGACSIAEQRLRAQEQQQPEQSTGSTLYNTILYCIEQASTGGGSGSCSRDSIVAIAQHSELQAAALRLLGFSSSTSAIDADGRRQQRREDDGDQTTTTTTMSQAEIIKQQLDGACCLIFIACRTAIDMNSLVYEMRPCRSLKEVLQKVRRSKKDGALLADDDSDDKKKKSDDDDDDDDAADQQPPALMQIAHEYTEYAEIHSHFTGLKSDTGRIFSTGPNLQVLPRSGKSQLRQALVAPPGTVLVSIDYSQFELKVVAHLSGDPQMIAAMREQRDILAEITADLLGVQLGQQQQQHQQPSASQKGAKKAGGKKAKQQTAAAAAAAAASSQQQQQQDAPAFLQPGTPAFVAARNAVKTVTYGTLFGMGDAAVADNVSQIIKDFAQQQQQQQQPENAAGSDAVERLAEKLGDRQRLRGLFFGRFPRVRHWIDECTSSARIHASARTLSGMRRDLSGEMDAAVRNDRGLGDPMAAVNRQAVATAVQGTAADILKVAMCTAQAIRAVTEEEQQTKRRQDIYRPFALLLSVHDELVFALDNRDAERVERIVGELAQAMRNAGDVLVQRVAPQGQEEQARFAVPLEVKVSRGPTFGF